MAKGRQRAMTMQALELVAARFKVLADPLRLNILQTLEGGEMSVNVLTVAVGALQPSVSKHLKMLQEAGFVQRRQDGNTVYYSIADQTVYELCDLMCNSLQQRFAAQAQVITSSVLRTQKRRG